MLSAMIAEIERIRTALKSGMVVKAHLAREAGVHVNTLAGAADEEWYPSTRTVRKIVGALDRMTIDDELRANALRFLDDMAAPVPPLSRRREREV